MSDQPITFNEIRLDRLPYLQIFNCHQYIVYLE